MARISDDNFIGPRAHTLLFVFGSTEGLKIASYGEFSAESKYASLTKLFRAVISLSQFEVINFSIKYYHIFRV